LIYRRKWTLRANWVGKDKIAIIIIPTLIKNLIFFTIRRLIYEKYYIRI